MRIGNILSLTALFFILGQSVLSTAQVFNPCLLPDTGKIHIQADSADFAEDDFDSDDIDSLLTEFWETNQVFAYRTHTKTPDSIWIILADSSRGFAMPVDGQFLNGYGPRRGRMHKGVDIRLKTGDPVHSAFDGIVRYAHRNKRGFGNLVVIRHYSGLETYYAHLSKIHVKPGDKVKAGDVIGLGGSTGRSRGPHLHFEIRYFDKAFDPEKFICFQTGSLKVDSLFVCRDLYTTRTRLTAFSPPGDTLVGKNEILHTIRKGDTLGKIARKYGTTVNQICRANNIKSNKILRVGHVLKVTQ